MRAGIDESARVDAQIDHALAQSDRATVSLQNGHFPAHVGKTLLDYRLEPEKRRAAKRDYVGAVFLACCNCLPQRRLHALRCFAALRAIFRKVHCGLSAARRTRQRIVDIAYRRTALS